MANIKFGTDGWRSIVGKDFNDANVKLVIDAIAKYVFDKFGLDKKIIIGYDPRNKADEYAQMSAEILCQKGFNVILSEKFVPTPILAFYAKIYNASAIMFTASHNPPEYLGIKYIPDYAGPATTEITEQIVKNIGKNIPNNEKGSLKTQFFFDEYLTHIEEIVDFNKIKKANKKIIFDALYSAASGYFDLILDKKGIKYEILHNYRDVNFGGGLPEPKPKYLTELIEKVKTTPDAIGLSNDGDADRYGVINEKGEYVTPNEVMCLLLSHLVKNKKLSGKYVKTVGSSLMHDILAMKLGIQIIETPVGFKYVGQAMREKDVILAGEESGGLSIKGHIPEKDGLLANLLIMDMLSQTDKYLYEIQDELKSFIGVQFINDRIDIKLDSKDEIKEIIEKFNSDMKLHELLGIKKIGRKDGIKLYLSDSKSWLLVRPSGTEPLLRIYIETDSQEKMNQLKKIAKNVATMEI